MPDDILLAASPAQQQALLRQVDAWSDRSQETASKLAEQFRDLLPKRIGNAQLSGLNNIVRSEIYFEQVKKFIKHQEGKAERADREDVQGYWKAVGDALEKLENDAWEVAQKAGLPVPPLDSRPKEMKNALNEIYLLLAREWVQHFVAQSMFLNKR